MEMTNETESGDYVCEEADGCPTENAVLKREWRRLTDENKRLRLAVTNTRDALDMVLMTHNV
jgi:hypothetical protein